MNTGNKIIKTMYRICKNPRCNDWNNEPEHLAVPYHIIKEKKKSYVCMRAGWHQKNVMAKKEFYGTPEECTAAIIEKYSVYPVEKRHTDEQLETLWGILGEIPVNDNDELERSFIDFPAGTPKEEVWKWFDDRHSKGVYVLMYGEEKEDEQ